MATPFAWPNGARCALSLTFDDARVSQIDVGLPILDAHGLKGTFYVSPGALEKRLRGWKLAVENGHEIGNHTFTHPCSGNFAFMRERANPLERLTLNHLEADMRKATAWIRKTLGVTPRTFAYPCGLTEVGSGAATQSYVPLVARHFLAGRAFRQEQHNHPSHCDLARLWALEADGQTFACLRAWLDAAERDGGWVVLAAHEVGEKARQTFSATALERLCAHVAGTSSGVWVDTVAAVAEHVKATHET